MTIQDIRARMVFDSRGVPTVEAEIVTDNGHVGRAIVPSGASTGTHEAVELRDEGEAFHGKGVQKALANIREAIRPGLIGMDPNDQQSIDRKLLELDGTDQKSHLGANATLAISLAAAHAAATSPLYEHIATLYKTMGGIRELSLPLPMVNVLNGGAHASSGVDVQEIMLIPVGAESFDQAMEMIADVFHSLKKLLASKGYATTVGDEGGFAPAVSSNKEAMQLLVDAIKNSRFEYGRDIKLGLDVASSEFYKDGKYEIKSDGLSLSSDEMVSWIEGLKTEFDIVSIEDGVAEDDWAGWAKLTAEIGGSTQLVGDDLLVTNPKLLRKAIEQKAANAILIKPNQIGTLTETLDAIITAQNAGWNTVISHRSGETEDVTIAHLAVGTGAGQIKTGSLSRAERTAKYNELLRIGEVIGYDKLAKGILK
jgi:enolase